MAIRKLVSFTMHRGPPTSLLAQTCFQPVGRPSQPPAPSTYRPPHQRCCQVGPPLRHAYVVVVILALYRFG
jgi:hypothetical protein